jgi:SNF2 family DNA or RNA helicase
METIENRMDMFRHYLNRTNMEHKHYQYEGVRWCLKNELAIEQPHKVRGGFIADEMGLGKTIMMIGLMYTNFVSHTLVIVPPILIDQWFLQIYKTTGHKALIYHGENKKTITLEQLNAAPIVISSYGGITLTKKQNNTKIVTMLHKVSWKRIIFDEAHHLRNPNTSCHKSARKLPSKIRWLVSGTPIQNNKKDFYSLCAFIGLPASFYTEACNLQLLTQHFILKRTKKQVGILMTDIQVNNNIVNWNSQSEMSLSEELHSALSFSNVSTEKGINKQIVDTFRKSGTLSLMLRAKQSCIYPKLMCKRLDKLVQSGLLKNYSSYTEAFNHSSKLDAVIHYILERKENGCGKLIFCHFREEIDEIATRLRNGGMTKVATFDGRTSNGKRNDILNDQNDALIMQIQTGCEGLNLQENYSEIYFISPHWNPAIEDQAIARCHRIGQTKPVYVEKFEMSSFIVEENNLSTRTLDKYVNDVQESKRFIINEILAS